MQRTLRNETLKNALRNFVVPIFSNRYFITSFRALWDVDKERDKEKAELNIWEKQQRLNTVLKDVKEVVAFFSCLTAMESAFIKRKLRDHKRRVNEDRRLSGSDTDNDFDSYADEGIIPGNEFV